MAIQDFGKPINLEKTVAPETQSGNEMLTKAVMMNKNYLKKLTTMVGSDIDAKRFYCKSEQVYVFPYSSIKKLITNLKDDDDCILLFSGARIDPESPKIKGRPTLLAFAYKINGQYLNFIQADEKNNIDGYEHPGGGGRINAIGSNGSGSYTIKKSIDIGVISML